MYTQYFSFVCSATDVSGKRSAEKSGEEGEGGTVGMKKNTDFCARTTAREITHRFPTGGKMGFKIITIILLETNLCDRSDKQTRLLPFIFIFFPLGRVDKVRK